MLFLKSCAKSVCSRPFLAMSSALVMIAGMLFGANIATADSVWVQSYERSSQTQVCEAQPGETPWQESWGTDSSWSPSWEMWANNGSGGWTCTRSITWARSTPAARSYSLGDIGPGGGLVFLISGGLTYEMAPKAWSGAPDITVIWCNNATTALAGIFSDAVGTGAANTVLMTAPACTISAANFATAYNGGGFTDWYLPSKDELNAMCNYSRNPGSPALPSVSCSGSAGTTQDPAFASGLYEFADSIYWSSSQIDSSHAWAQNFGVSGGIQDDVIKGYHLRVRPVRAF